MDTKSILLTVITLSFAFSGWGTLIYNHITSSPKIKGRVLQVMKGQTEDPMNGKPYTTFCAYAYLINLRKNAIHMLDYELEVAIGGKWVRLDRVYGVQNRSFSFSVSEGQRIVMDNFPDNLIYRKKLPVEYGNPLHGWILFFGDRSLYNEKITEYRLTCIDAYNERHAFKSRPQDFVNPYLLADIAEMKIPASVVNRP